MPELPPNCSGFFQAGSLVTIGIDLPGRAFAEDRAVVHSAGNGEILLELCGSWPAHVRVDSGARAIVTGGEGRNALNAKGLIKSRLSGKFVSIELVDRVEVVERRAYVRADVLVPVYYSLPTSQEMGAVISEWQAFANGGANSDHAVPAASSRVNLSGSGLRFTIRDCLSYGTLLHVKIAIPHSSALDIHAVGSIVRTKELLPEMNRIEYYSTSMSFRMIKSTDRLNLIRHIIDARHKDISH